MPNVCVICKKKKGQHQVTFHRFPKDENLCNIWIQNIGLNDKFRLSQKRICSEHFDSASYLPNTNRLKLNAAPKMANSVEINSKLIEVPKCATPQPFVHISDDPDVTNNSFLSPVELFPRTPESLPECSKNCSTSDISSRASSSCSTPCSDSETQTGLGLSKNTPRKIKLKERLCYTDMEWKSALKECENLKTIIINLKDKLDGPVTLTGFYNMCDTFFASKPTMCNFIKNQARLYQKNMVKRLK